MSLLDGASLLLWVIFFPIPFFWLLVHPFAEFWRRRRGRTHAAFALTFWLAAACFFLGTWEFWFAARFPRSWLTNLLGAALLAVEAIVIPQAEGQLGVAILIGRAELDPRQFPPRLVDTGIYRHVRHPRYLSAISAIWGTAVLSGATRFLILAVLSVPLFYWVTLVEERELAERLGAPFREYQKRVPRFIPRLWPRLWPRLRL